MKKFIIFLFLICSFSLVNLANLNATPHNLNKKLISNDEEWELFKLKYDKKYQTKAEESLRKEIYTRNKEIIRELNKKNSERNGQNVFGVTKFSDLDTKEFKKLYLTPNITDFVFPRAYIKPAFLTAKFTQLKDNFNWQDKGAINKIRNQGSCGACWAFSAAEMVESMVFIATGTLPTLSVQQIISCDSVDAGCNGGFPANAFDYINGVGLEGDHDYPYIGSKGSCNYDFTKVKAHISGWQYVIPICSSGSSCLDQSNYEYKLKQSIATIGPASIAVNASVWQFYRGGVLASNCRGEFYFLNHAAQLIGYGIDNAPYWIVRNQWGADWGENGNIRLSMGDNMCGLADFVTIPTGVSVV